MVIVQRAAPELVSATGFRRSVAAVIGIDAYANGIPPLRSARNDAKRLALILKDDHKYDSVETLLDEQASRAALTQLFTKTLPELVDEGDRVLVYFAGHGMAGNDEIGVSGRLVPQDASLDEDTLLPMNDLYTWLNDLRCRHLLLILDCCFAGTFRWSATRDLPIMPKKLYRERYTRFIEDAAWQVLTSAAADEKALDVLSQFGDRAVNGDHSPFALALFDGLLGKADTLTEQDSGRAHGDGVITATDVYSYLRDRVETYALAKQRRQTPGIWSLPKHRKGEFVFLVPGQSVDLPAAPALSPANNPYQGLTSFDQAHHDLFFGRDEEADLLLGQHLRSQPLTVVIGRSGSGKSSLVQAGLLPRLREDTLHSWYILDPIRPSNTPLRDIAGLPAADPPTLAARVGAWAAAHADTSVVLVIDQLEELVTLCSEQEREQMLAELADALAANPTQLRVILMVREDFRQRLAGGPLAEHWTTACEFRVGEMNQDDLRKVIIGPAAARVLYFEPDSLVDAIINDVVKMPGLLPLLSFTLSEMYLRYLSRHADNRTLTLADYQAAGGVAGALGQHASAVYDRLSEAHRATARRVLLRMVSLDGDSLGRRKVLRTELVYPDDAENARVRDVLGILEQARLVVGGCEQDGDEYVEPAHDALIQTWDKLRAWVEAERNNLELQRRLAKPAEEWQQRMRAAATAGERRRAAGLLWNNNPYLEQASAALLAPGGWLNHAERTFVGASGKLRQRQHRQRNVILAAIMIVVAMFAIVSWSLKLQADDATKLAEGQTLVADRATKLAEGQTLVADRATKLAESRALFAEAQVALERDNASDALLMALLIAKQPNGTPDAAANPNALQVQAEAILADAAAFTARLRVEMRVNPLSVIAWHPDRREYLTGTFNGVVHLWDLASGTEQHSFSPAKPARKPISAIAWSPNGQRFLTGDDSGTIRLWDVASGIEQRSFRGGAEYINSVAFSPDGHLAASGSDHSILRIWDVSSGQEKNALSGQDAPVYSVAFSPDGQSILSASYGEIYLWDLRTGALIRHFDNNATTINSVAFSPDGHLAASGGDDTAVHIWDVSSGKEIHSLLGHQGNVLSVAFSPDGNTIVSGSADQTIRIWDVPSHKQVRSIQGHQDAVISAVFTPDGAHILSGSHDRTVREWDVFPAQELRRFPLRQGTTIKAIALNQQERTAVTISSDGTLSVWDTGTGETTSSFKIAERLEPNDRPALSPDGKYALLFTFSDLTFRVWDVQRHEKVSEQTKLDSAVVSAVAISPDGTSVLFAERGSAWVNSVHIRELNPSWDKFGAGADGSTVAFSQDGRQFITASHDGTIRLWDGATHRQLNVFKGPVRLVTSIAFSVDGSKVVTGSDDQTIQVWDLPRDIPSQLPRDAQPLRELRRIVGQSDTISSLALSADGKSILSGSDDGTLRLWRVDTSQELTAWICVNRYIPDVMRDIANTYTYLTLTPPCPAPAGTPGADEKLPS